MVRRFGATAKKKEHDVMKFLIAGLVIQCILCAGCASTGRPDLTGKWINDDMGWGLEFQGSRVSEWERDNSVFLGTYAVTRTGEYDIKRTGDSLSLHLDTKGSEGVVLALEVVDKNSIRLTKNNAQDETIELTRQTE